MPAVMIGMLPDQTYDVENIEVPAGHTLFVFSDGAYEIVTKEGVRTDFDEFLPLLTAPSVPGTTEPERVYQVIRQVAKAGPLDDDFSLMALTF
jgi:sigma-B regulation protein RsbU (phosphoserine phosphatase)